jgi:hypothetical protein
MTKHLTGTRGEWLARLELLQAEKALTRSSDELARPSVIAAGHPAQSASLRSERIKNAPTGATSVDNGFRYLVRARGAVRAVELPFTQFGRFHACTEVGKTGAIPAR